MSEVEQTPAAAEIAAPESETVVDQVVPDTTETVAETDEQKNERELAERQKRSERASRGIQKRFDELTADKHAERQRADQLARTVEQLLSLQQGKAQPQGQANGPTREQFADYESFLDARAEWKAEQKANAALSHWQAQQQRQAKEMLDRMQQDQAVSQVQTHLEAFAQKAGADWKNLVQNADDVKLPDNFRQDVMVPLGADSGPLLLALGKNPALADKFWNTTPQQRLVMATKIVAGSTSTQVSNAPAPGKPVGARGSAPTGYREDMTMDEFAAWRKKSRG